jgi:hypothetical protein
VKRAWNASAIPGTPGTHACTWTGAALGCSAEPEVTSRTCAWLTSRTYKNEWLSPGTLGGMRFDSKIAVIVRDDPEPWQRLNVTAFLASGVAANPDLLGEPYADADGTRYLPLFRQPVLVTGGRQDRRRGGPRAGRAAAYRRRC